MENTQAQSADKTEFRRNVVLSVLRGATYAEVARQHGLATPNARYFVHDYLRRLGVQPDERQDMNALIAMAPRLIPDIEITASVPGRQFDQPIETLPMHALKIETALVVRFRAAGIETVQDFLDRDPKELLLIRSVTPEVLKTIRNYIAEAKGELPSVEDGKSKPVVLAVEDDAVMLATLSEVLAQQGYEVVEAESGAQALAMCEERVPDLVVVDLQMPEVDGLALCKALRKRPKLAKMPIVVASQYDDDETIQRAFEAGASDYFTKPIPWAVFRNRINLLLQNTAVS